MFSGKLSAQTCPSNYTANLSATSAPRTCANNGTITSTFTAASGITIELLKSGGVQSSVNNPTSPYTFSNLAPGTDYEVLIKCTEDGTIYQTIPVTVEDNYVPISDAIINVTDVCTNFTPGGTITVAGVTGGSAPYQYSFVQSDNPAYDDSLSNYGDSSTFNATAFGNYQIRIKDACGNYRTFTRTISPTVNPVRFYWRPKRICGDNENVEGWNWYLTDVTTSGSTNFSTYAAAGIHLVIREGNASGAILFDGVYDGNPFTYKMAAGHIYHVTTTTGCGQSTSYTHNLNNATNPEFESGVIHTGMVGCGDTAQMTISGTLNDFSFWNYPITVTVTDSSGATVYTNNDVDEYETWTTTQNPGNYQVTYTSNSCPSQTLTLPATDPTVNPAPAVVHVHAYVKWRCQEFGLLTQTGTTQLIVRIEGFVPDRANAVVKIDSGPSNVGVVAGVVPGGQYGWTNILPGTYVVSITSCDTTTYHTINVNASGNNILQQSLSSKGESFCSGGGTISSNKVYNGDYTSTVQLLDSDGNIVAANTTGVFTNLPAGTYTTRMLIQALNCSGTGYTIPGSTVTLYSATTGPSISSAVGVICEDAEGNPIGTGNAYLSLGGVGPFTLNYRKSGETTWNVITNASSVVTLTGLEAYTIYEVQVIDGCGGDYNTTLQVNTMGVLNTETNAHPCVNSQYTLAMPQYAGATYKWTDPNGNVISNTRSVFFSNYQVTNDGTYVVKITWGTCVERYVYVTLNSNLCGQPFNDACFKTPVGTGTSEPTLLGITAFGRAGEGNSNWPMERKGGFIALESSTKGFVITRAAHTDIANPVVGMMIYCTVDNCVEIYTEDGWKCFTEPGCPD